MERLTRVFAKTTHGTKGYELINKIKVDTESISNLSEIITILGKLEDVLEEFNIDDTEDLKNHLLFRINYVNSKKFADLVYKIKDLEQELAELKQKVIILEKAFDLACDPRDDWGGKEYSGMEFDNYHDYFIAEAEQKLAEIGGKDE